MSTNNLEQAIFEAICDVPIPTLAIPRIMALMAAEREREGRDVAEAIKFNLLKSTYVMKDGLPVQLVQTPFTSKTVRGIESVLADRYGKGEE
jgi:SH3-like domain-containing protein